MKDLLTRATGTAKRSGPVTLAAEAASFSLAPGQRPQISLLELLTNRDGCQDASLSPIYATDARLG